MKDSIFITLGIYLFGIIIGKYVQYKLLEKKEYKTLNIISLILIPIIFNIFGLLTYYPLHNGLFYDYYDLKENKDNTTQKQLKKIDPFYGFNK